MNSLEADTLVFQTKLEDAALNADWRKAVDALTAALRKGFVFDNLALYLADKPDSIPEPVYARAVGRGRSAEADASWGEEIANQVISSGKITQITPQDDPQVERVRRPYLLGLPLTFIRGCGALVFVRFGGPSYEPDQVSRAMMAGTWFTHILDCRLLRDQNEQLESARKHAQLQDDFIATVSHDLRTTIGFIKGYTTSLLRSDTIWNEETQREFLTIIDEESDHLMALIDRMLDSARLKNGMMVMDFQPLRLEALIRDEVQRTRAHNPDLVVNLKLKSSPRIRADSVRLAQVFENLFDNAIKYAPGAPITISTLSSAGHITVLFSDQGPGIPAEHMQFLFERFYRVPESLSNRGTGLGLFICREIIRAHGGTICAESSQDGNGTVFRIDLPLEVGKE